ncbi:MAG: hypothetical protein HOH92_08305 [Crocinitomicaceae bacterium]|nr:hypothetical protein [Crocinitomicaceae bacterium]
MKLNDSEKTQLRNLFESNGLSKDDIFVAKHFTIVKRSGIQKIQATQNIHIEFEVIQCDRDFVVIKAHGWRRNDPEKRIETYGSATKENCMSKHLVEMSEKRAMSRCVLSLTNLYQHGFFGEDEDIHRG